MPDSLIVIRAGATDYELQGRIRGTLDVPLCAAGEEEARQAAGLLPIGPRALYTSRELSALDTSRIVGGRAGLKPRILDGLHNLDQGLWQGLLVDEIRRKQPRLYRQWQDNPWSVAPPEGELLEDACERVERSLEHIHRRHARGLVALVVSDPLDRIVRWLVAGESMGDLWARDQQREPLVELPLTAQWTQRARPGTRERTLGLPRGRQPSGA
jgi:broad specificity phosphatase PhoE